MEFIACLALLALIISRFFELDKFYAEEGESRIKLDKILSTQGDLFVEGARCKIKFYGSFLKLRITTLIKEKEWQEFSYNDITKVTYIESTLGDYLNIGIEFNSYSEIICEFGNKYEDYFLAKEFFKILEKPGRTLVYTDYSCKALGIIQKDARIKAQKEFSDFAIQFYDFSITSTNLDINFYNNYFQIKERSIFKNNEWQDKIQYSDIQKIECSEHRLICFNKIIITLWTSEKIILRFDYSEFVSGRKRTNRNKMYASYVYYYFLESFLNSSFVASLE